LSSWVEKGEEKRYIIKATAACGEQKQGTDVSSYTKLFKITHQGNCF